MDTGLYVGILLLATTTVLAWDPCPLGLPEVRTAAPTTCRAVAESAQVGRHLSELSFVAQARAQFMRTSGEPTK